MPSAPRTSDDFGPRAATAEAARVAVAEGFGKAATRLKKARRTAGADTRAVHKLRTACRRAGSAIDAFAPCLPEDDRKDAGKLLKKARKAAGDVRDLDVQTKMWRRLGNEEPAAADAAAAMIRRGRKKRKKARRRLVEDLAAIKPKHLRRAGDRLADGATGDGLTGDDRATLAGFAQSALAAMSDDLRSRIVDGAMGPDQLHKARIAEKRLRYAVDLLGPALDRGIDAQLREDLRALHDGLGEQHDLYVARGLLDRLEKKGKVDAEKITPLRRVVDDRLIDAHREAVAQLARFAERWLSLAPRPAVPPDAAAAMPD